MCVIVWAGGEHSALRMSRCHGVYVIRFSILGHKIFTFVTLLVILKYYICNLLSPYKQLCSTDVVKCYVIIIINNVIIILIMSYFSTSCTPCRVMDHVMCWGLQLVTWLQTPNSLNKAICKHSRRPSLPNNPLQQTYKSQKHGLLLITSNALNIYYKSYLTVNDLRWMFWPEVWWTMAHSEAERHFSPKGEFIHI